MITDNQRKKLFVLFREASKASDREPSYYHGWASGRCGVTSLNDLDNGQFSALVEAFEAQLEEHREEEKRREPFERGVRMRV